MEIVYHEQPQRRGLKQNQNQTKASHVGMRPSTPATAKVQSFGPACQTVQRHTLQQSSLLI